MVKTGTKIFIIFAGIALWTATAYASPTVYIRNTLYNFGIVELDLGKVLIHNFTIMNKGTTDLEIKNVKPG